jgi:hypothetical protein
VTRVIGVAKTWILDRETKGTGATVRPLEDAPEKPAERSRPRPPVEAPKRAPRTPKPAPRTVTSSTPLGPGQVRKKATGELGKILSVDPKAGTAVVRWMREGRTSTVPLTAVTRR